MATSAALVGASLTFVSPAQAAADKTVYFKLRNASNGKCLDADKEMITKNGTRLQLWDCHGGKNQWWYADGQTIRNRASGRCLDADKGTADANGTRVRLWDCTDTDRQRWRSEPTTSGYTVIVSVSTGRGLDADRNVLFQNGTEVQLWSDWDTFKNLNQQWYTTMATA